MLVMRGGPERTLAEFEDLLRQSSFALGQHVPTASPLGIVVARPV